MSVALWIKHDRRLALLRYLVEANGKSSARALEWAMKAGGDTTGMNSLVVQAELKFLETKFLVELEYPREDVMIAAITKRGVACAEGSLKIEGVAQPDLGR